MRSRCLIHEYLLPSGAEIIGILWADPQFLIFVNVSHLLSPFRLYQFYSLSISNLLFLSRLRLSNCGYKSPMPPISAVKDMDSSLIESSTCLLLDDSVNSFTIQNQLWSLHSNYHIYEAWKAAISTVKRDILPSLLVKVVISFATPHHRALWVIGRYLKLPAE